jgi:hypothetical protein
MATPACQEIKDSLRPLDLDDSRPWLVGFSLRQLVRHATFDLQSRVGQHYRQRRRALRTAARICAMKKSNQPSLTQPAMAALADAVAKVVEDHRRQARPLAVWRDGKAVWIPATETGVLREPPTP